MTTSPPLLSICIPTFNRAGHLKECLQSVVTSHAAHRDKVELIVSDNASTDDTAEIVRCFQDSGHVILYSKHQANIGPHANFRAAAEAASGRFIWLLGDDDKLDREAVGSVLKKIEGGAEAVVCNVAVFSRDFGRLIKPRFIARNHDTSFTNANQVMELLGGHAGYISGIVVNKAAFLQVPLDEYMSFASDGTCFLYAVYCSIRPCHRIEFIAEPLVLNRGDAPDSDLISDGRQSQPSRDQIERAKREWNRVFAVGFPRTIGLMTQHGYCSGSVRKAQNSLVFDYLLPRLLALKNGGRGSLDLTISSLKHLKHTWVLWLLFLPAAMLPPFALNRLRWAKRVLSRNYR